MQRKRGNAAVAADGPAAKVARLDQRRISAGVGDQDDMPGRGRAGKNVPEVIDLAGSSDSSDVSRLALPPLPAPLVPQHDDGAVRDELAAAQQAAVHPPETDANAIPTKVQVGSSATYIISRRLGKGGFGSVYLGTKTARGRKTNKPTTVAVKLEKQEGSTAAHEWAMYREIGESYGLGKFLAKGRVGNWNVMIMELLGISLWDAHSLDCEALTPRMLACIAVEAVTMLQQLHARGCVHGDIKPENMVFSDNCDDAPRLHLIDLGLAVPLHQKSRHNAVGKQRYNCQPNNFRGTTRYASLHAHLGRTAAPRDDLESLAYSLLYLARGSLPWQGHSGDEDEKRLAVALSKSQFSARRLCAGVDPRYHGIRQSLLDFTDDVLNVQYDQQPDYGRYVRYFLSEAQQDAAGPPPISLAPIHLRPKETGNSAEVRRKVRQASIDIQQLTVYNDEAITKQRYYSNVTEEKLEEAVRKGWAEARTLHISAILSARPGTWSIVLTSNQGFSQQVYEISDQFPNEKFVKQKWEAGFYITAIAGMAGTCRRSIVVMSKGRTTKSIVHQAYKVAKVFPFEWIKEKWQQRYYVTAAATWNGQWAIVATLRTVPHYRDQVCELDFAYPSEGIHIRWNDGYRITASASTKDQTVVFLSLAAKAKPHVVQETLRSDAWPTSETTEKWDRGLYISCICHGRMTH